MSVTTLALIALAKKKSTMKVRLKENHRKRRNKRCRGKRMLLIKDIIQIREITYVRYIHAIAF